MTEVAAITRGSAIGLESKQQVTGPAAEVEDARAGPAEHRTDLGNSPRPPQLIDVERKEVVRQIVSMGDAPEHIAHPARSLLFA